MKRSQIIRLALYLHTFRSCARLDDSQRLTSEELGEAARVNPTQVRRDLSTVLGRVGKRGVGYQAGRLQRELEVVLRDEENVIQEAALDYSARASALNEVVELS